MTPALTAAQIERYSRHLTLPQVGGDGQRRLRSARILVVGAGGLGSPVALYLAAAGIGKLGLVDDDVVDRSNLQRQVLYLDADVGEAKVAVAARRLRGLNPDVEVVEHPHRFDAAHAFDLLADYDLVVDGTDNFATRYLVNDACVLAGKPDVYGSVFRFEGQCSVFATAAGPCYRCLYPDPPEPGSVPNCAEGGVLGILPGVIGSLQATEALKLVLEAGDSLAGRLVLFDALGLTFRELTLRKDPACPICGEQPTICELHDEEAVCAADGPAEIEVEELARRLGEANPPFLLDVRSPEEWSICRLEGATLIPLQELETRLGELDPERETVVYCHVGGRSAMAVTWLAARGFLQVRNLSGGIHAWSARIDPEVPRY